MKVEETAELESKICLLETPQWDKILSIIAYMLLEWAQALSILPNIGF